MSLADVSTLIFDLDGTISDPSLGIARSLNYALTTCGFAAVPTERVLPHIGPPLESIFRSFCPEVDEGMIAGLIAHYRDRYLDVGYTENTLYPGVIDEVRRLSERGVRLGVCTAKRQDIAQKIVDWFGLRDCFAFVSGGEVGVKKSQQLAALLAADKIDGAAVMMGDREVDILAAQANGLRSVGVLWGFGSGDELAAVGPDVLLQEVREIGRLIRGVESQG